MEEKSRQPYRFHPIHLHWVSIDVVAAALVSHLAASRMPNGNTPVNGWVPVILGLVVLGVYTLDHLLDIRRPEQPRTQRHAFIREHQALIWRITLGVLLVAAGLSWLLPFTLWKFGAGLGTLAGLYLVSVSRIPIKSNRQALKEPLTALIYAGGVWGSTWFIVETVAWESIVLGVVFLLLTFQSLLLFSHFEAIRFREVYNLARWMQRPLTMRVLKGITLATVLTTLVVLFMTDYRYTQRLSLFLLAMALIHHWMLANPEKGVQERFRIVGEMVFLLPGLAL